MGQIIHFVHQSLDGFIAGPNGEFDWPAMGPELSAYTDELIAVDSSNRSRVRRTADLENRP
ncbi:hypothetical protein [Streptomyces narbonensis]